MNSAIGLESSLLQSWWDPDIYNWPGELFPLYDNKHIFKIKKNREKF